MTIRCRLLIEHSTGVYTGSVYNDQSLLEALPGEFTCNWQVSAIKVHPHTHEFKDLRLGTFGSDNGKCNKGGVRRFERAILLLRDPFDSIWSEYQRRVTQSHVAGIPIKGFDWHRWQANAASLSHGYHNMWSVQHSGILRHFKKEDVLFIRYELLKSATSRVQELERVYNFLIHPHTTSLPPSPALPALPAGLQERLKCAFILAESRHAHREVRGGDVMTKQIAYTKPLVCRMWSLFGTYASQYGYRPFNNFTCDNNNDNGANNNNNITYPAIPKINVGPQGEYNHKWVRPGQKLIDFGGYKVDGSVGPPVSPLPLNGAKLKRKKRIRGNKEGTGNGLGMSLSDAVRTTVTGDQLPAVGSHQAAWK